jgi:hypothetical protein
MSWTETARREHDRSGLRYASDCTEIPPTERRSCSFRGRCEQAGIQPQAADERCPSYDSMRQFMNGKAAVTYKDDPTTWQPAR